MVDRLLRLWHDAVVRRHHDDGQVGHLGTTGTHGRERLVTWGVEEGDFLAAIELHRICTDVLGDAARLASDDVGLADKVEQRRFSVVDVTHDRHNRWARHQVLLGVFLDHDGLLHLGADKLHFKAKFFGDDGDGLRIQTLVDGHHDAQRHARRNDFVDPAIHHRGQLGHRDEFGHLQDAFFQLRLEVALLVTLLDGVALAATELGRLGLLAAAQTGEGGANFLLDVFLADFFLGLVAASTAALVASAGLVARLADVHFLDAHTLPLAVLSGRFLFLDWQFNLAHHRRSRQLFRTGPDDFRFGGFGRRLGFRLGIRRGLFLRRFGGWLLLGWSFLLLGRFLGGLLGLQRLQVHRAHHLGPFLGWGGFFRCGRRFCSF